MAGAKGGFSLILNEMGQVDKVTGTKINAYYNDITKAYRIRAGYKNVVEDANGDFTGTFLENEVLNRYTNVYAPQCDGVLTDFIFTSADKHPWYHTQMISTTEAVGTGLGYPPSNSKYARIPIGTIVPNCVGGIRGRYWRIANRINEGDLKLSKFSTDPEKKFKPLPGMNAKNYVDWGPWSKQGTEKIYNTWFWKDVNGEYGPAGGLWGKAYAGNGSTPLPGSIFCWTSGTFGHVEFVDGILDFGQPTERVITTRSAWSNSASERFSDHNVLCSNRINKIQGNASYYYKSGYGSPWILYTPLCMPYLIPGDYGSGESTKVETQDLTDAEGEITPEGQEIINNIKEELGLPISNGVMTLKPNVGDKVRIEWIGKTKPDGMGFKINRINMVGWVRSIESGMPFSYAIYTSQSGGSLIGYYSSRELRILK